MMILYYDGAAHQHIYATTTHHHKYIPTRQQRVLDTSLLHSASKVASMYVAIIYSFKQLIERSKSEINNSWPVVKTVLL